MKWRRKRVEKYIYIYSGKSGMKTKKKMNVRKREVTRKTERDKEKKMVNNFILR